MEIQDQERKLCIKNLQLISPERAEQLGIKADSPIFAPHCINIFFRQRVFDRPFNKLDESLYRFWLNQPMPAKNWILGYDVLDQWQVSHDSMGRSGGDFGKWIAILEDNYIPKEWWKADVIRAKELRAYCWNNLLDRNRHVKRLFNGYLLYDPRPGEIAYKSGFYYPVCDLEKHHAWDKQHPIYEFSISENGLVDFKALKA